MFIGDSRFGQIDSHFGHALFSGVFPLKIAGTIPTFETDVFDMIQRIRLSFFILLITSFYACESSFLSEEASAVQEELYQIINNSIENGVDLSKEIAIVNEKYGDVISNNQALQYLYKATQGVNYNTKGDYVKSRPILQEVLPYYEGLEFNEGLFIIYRCLGYSYYEESNYALAFDYYYKAFRSTEDPEELGDISLDIAEVYNELNLKEDTQIFLDVAKENFLKSGNEEYLNYVNLGYYAINAKGFEDPQSVNPIIAYLTEVEDAENLNFAYFNKAKRFLGVNKDSALFYNQKSLELAELTESRPYIALAGLIATRVYLDSNEIDKAETEGIALMKLLREFELESYLLYIYEEMITVYERKGDYVTANQYHQRKDSIIAQQQNTIQIKSIADVRLRDEVVTKNDEIASQIENRNLLILLFIVFALLAAILIQAIINRNKRRKLQIENDLAKEKELNHIRTKFLGNVSHEIRTPLTLVTGNIQLALEELEDPEKATRYLDSALHNSKKVIEDANEILQILKYEKGKQEVHYTATAVDKFFKRTFLSFDSTANDKGIMLEYNSSVPTSLWSNMDQNKTEKILNNLITNALKFSPSDTKIICNASLENNQIKVTIIDYGVGIHSEDQQKIFDRFYQSQHTKSVGGIGIGLALSKEFANLLQGSLTVESTVNKGSSFTLTLPLEEVESPIEVILPIKEVKKGQKPRLLVVEDNIEMSKYLSEILGKDYEITQAFDGEDALKKIKEQDFDLITSDVMMPKVDGFELREEVNKLPNKKDIPYILITAKVLDRDKIKGYNLGINDYIVKPFNKNELLARVSNLIENSINKKAWKLETKEIEEESFDQKLVYQIQTVVEDNMSNENFKIEDLAREIGYSQRQLSRLLNEYTGMSPVKFVLEIRLQRAYQLIQSKVYPTLSEVKYEIGISSTPYFNTKFKERFGVKPRDL